MFCKSKLNGGVLLYLNGQNERTSGNPVDAQRDFFCGGIDLGPLGDVAQRGGDFMWFSVVCGGVITVFFTLRPDAYVYFVAYAVVAATWAWRHSSDYQGPGLF